jgi:hypothetical protein
MGSYGVFGVAAAAATTTTAGRFGWVLAAVAISAGFRLSADRR